MDVLVHEGTDPFNRLQDSWNEILVRSEATSVFSHYEYLTCWWKHFNNGRRPFVVEFRDGGRTVGYAPLMERLAGSDGPPALGVIGHFADYCGLVVLPGYEESSASALIDLLAERDTATVIFDNFLEESAVFPALTGALASRNIRFRPSMVTRTPYVAIDGTWEGYLRRRSRNTYRDLRKKLNRLAGGRGLEVEAIEKPGAYVEHVPRMLRMHVSLWASRGRYTPYATLERRRFLKDVGLVMLDKGLLRFTCLRHEDRPVAYLWCYDHKGVRHYLNAAWDPEAAALSPGSLLLINDLRDAFERGMVEYDMLGGEERYKYRYATGRRHVTSLLAEDLGRSRPAIKPLRRAAAAGRRRNLLVVTHSDDEAIFFGAMLREKRGEDWTCCLVSTPTNSPRLREHRLAEFHHSCCLMGLEPVLLELDEPGPGDPLDPAETAVRLADRFRGQPFDAVYSHGPFGEYGNEQHASVSLAVHETFDEVWSPAGPLPAEQVVCEEPVPDFPDKGAYFLDVHYSQVFLADLVSPREGYARHPLERVRLVHRLFFRLPSDGVRPPALTAGERERAAALFDPLFDAYFSRRRCPAELAVAAERENIDMFTPLQQRILRAAAALAAEGGKDAVAGLARQLAHHPETVSPAAAEQARELHRLAG